MGCILVYITEANLALLYSYKTKSFEEFKKKNKKKNQPKNKHALD